MSQTMEDYVCASEDRWHYDNESYGRGRHGFETPMVAPIVTIVKHEVEPTEEEEDDTEE